MSESRPVKPRPKGLLFAPGFLNRPKAVSWLKRVHAWTGFWGALLFVFIGVSGFLLNHRSILLIEAGGIKEVSQVELPVDPNLIADGDALGAWTKDKFSLHGEAFIPAGAETSSAKVLFMGQEVQAVEIWARAFRHPNGILTARYVAGSTSVEVEQQFQNFWGFVKELHKGHGIGVIWVLFMDAMVGALLGMTMTGFLLWSRLHGSRLLAGAIIGTSAVMGIASVAPYLL